MIRFNRRLAGWVVAGLLGLAEPVAGVCPNIDFEDLAENTAVTTQYTGVTFSAQALPPACGISFARIQAPTSGTSSPNQALCVDNGSIGSPDCELHPQWLRVVFASAQHNVSFRVGPGSNGPQDYEIRAYTTTSGSSGEILPRTNVTAGDGVFQPVTISSASNILRIEVQAFLGVTSAGVECIDDLTLAEDTTPPIVEIDTPLFEACGCGIVTITGVACEDDGEYGYDMAEVRPIDADPGEPWQLIGAFSTPVCTSSTLYVWDTTLVAHGKYYVKVTVTNACGLQSTDTTVVYVDKQFDTVEGRHPEDGDVIGGNVCIEGTVWDHLCFDMYWVMYQPAGGGMSNPVDPGFPFYSSFVINDPFAQWDTTGVADGDYTVEVLAQDECGNVESVTRDITVDNTPPTAIISSPINCTSVDGMVQILGTAYDANLDEWRLHYTGGNANDWVPIVNSSTTPVVNGLLAAWDTAASQLPACTYTLRLRVFDKAIQDCDSPIRRFTSYFVTIDLGACCDINRDGASDGLDVQPFVQCVLENTGCP